jgi:hypothetical protein
MQQSVRSPITRPPPVRVVPVPSSDVEFTRYVRELASTQIDGPALEARIRQRYPRARVRPNDLSGRDAVLYAYRDGHWEPTRPS